MAKRNRSRLIPDPVVRRLAEAVISDFSTGKPLEMESPLVQEAYQVLNLLDGKNASFDAKDYGIKIEPLAKPTNPCSDEAVTIRLTPNGFKDSATPEYFIKNKDGSLTQMPWAFDSDFTDLDPDVMKKGEV